MIANSLVSTPNGVAFTVQLLAGEQAAALELTDHPW
jgi:hypothetical protein